MPPKINADTCEGCGSCVEICPAGVLEMKDDKALVILPDECLDCGACVDECINESIVLEA